MVLSHCDSEWVPFYVFCSSVYFSNWASNRTETRMGLLPVNVLRWIVSRPSNRRLATWGFKLTWLCQTFLGIRETRFRVTLHILCHIPVLLQGVKLKFEFSVENARWLKCTSSWVSTVSEIGDVSRRLPCILTVHVHCLGGEEVEMFFRPYFKSHIERFAKRVSQISTSSVSRASYRQDYKHVHQVFGSWPWTMSLVS